MQIMQIGMNQESVIADIEARAHRAGVSIKLLCRRADVNPTTFSRWKKSDRNPNPCGASLLSIGRLYEELQAVEASTSRRRGKAAA